MSVHEHAGIPPLERFRHEAALYSGLDGLVDTVVPFVRAGLAHGEPVLVALLPDRLKAVTEELGDDAERVETVNMAELGANPARIIPEWRRFVGHAADAGPFRGVGEPIWAGRRPVEIEECRLHEALLNTAFDDGPPWQLMCPYDEESLPDSVIEGAIRTHPVVSGDSDAGIGYDGQHGPEQFTVPLTHLPEDTYDFEFGPGDLSGLRGIVSRLGHEAGLDRDRTDDLVLAAHELATNSIIHGGGAGRLRAWREPEAFVVDIRDAGVIVDPLVGRELSLSMEENGRGVWMANQLCDLVQVRSNESGTAVRLFAWV
ncbi:MAG TPA: sensor histidine kinase [Nocardioidaceae bacterium]|nr:sensor histidine kinase [Nocardioidaceae bacterium]